jgi:spore coat protein U-like protein
MRRPRLSGCLALACVLMAAASPAAACVLDVIPVDFGAVDRDKYTFSTGRITVTCSEAVSYWLEMTPEPTTGAFREMHGPNGRLLLYNLYQDNSYTLTWGANIVHPALRGQSNGSTPSEHIVYGLVPPQPSAWSGIYTGTVAITLVF